jgi:hypothetical protein
MNLRCAENTSDGLAVVFSGVRIKPVIIDQPISWTLVFCVNAARYFSSVQE